MLLQKCTTLYVYKCNTIKNQNTIKKFLLSQNLIKPVIKDGKKMYRN